jgi:hypothetical protein
VICGDFNSRIGSLVPDLELAHPPRTSADLIICARATWFLELCEKYQYYISNGVHETAPFTCTTSRGSSVVDYILSSNLTTRTYTNAENTNGLSDHALIYTHVPVSSYDLHCSDYTHYFLSSDLRRGETAAHTTLYTPPKQ